MDAGGSAMSSKKMGRNQNLVGMDVQDESAGDGKGSMYLQVR